MQEKEEVQKKKVWFTEDEVQQSGKRIYNGKSSPPKWFLSRTLCKSAGAPVEEDEEPAGFKFNHTRRRYSALFDRGDLDMWKLPIYSSLGPIPDGMAAPAVASPRVKKGEKPVAYIRHIDSFTPLYARPSYKRESE